MPKGAMPSARGDDQVVVSNPDSPYDSLARPDGDVGDAAEQDANIRLIPKEAAYRPGDVSRRQTGRRDLIQQRLKQIVVALVDQGDPAARVAQRPRCSDAAKTAANDDHARNALI